MCAVPLLLLPLPDRYRILHASSAPSYSHSYVTPSSYTWLAVLRLLDSFLSQIHLLSSSAPSPLCFLSPPTSPTSVPVRTGCLFPGFLPQSIQRPRPQDPSMTKARSLNLLYPPRRLLCVCKTLLGCLEFTIAFFHVSLNGHGPRICQ